MATSVQLQLQFHFLVLVVRAVFSSSSEYLTGVGSYDITGPASDVNMMGYANSDQIVSGIHFRLRARAFIVADPQGNDRVAFVNIDACMASQIVTLKVLDRLKERYEGVYTEKNVAISGIHTHSGPGGYLQYVTYIVTSLGFVPQSFDVLVDGIEKAIVQAHESLRPGSVFVNKGDLLDAGVNRSPSSYLNNPEAERSKYEYNVDKEMTLLKFVDSESGPIGSFNWFATHGTSMSRTNSLISGDNKGAAARFMEDWFHNEQKNTSYVIPRRISTIVSDPKRNHSRLLDIAASYKSSRRQRLDAKIRVRNNASFVSAFCQSNCGDVSPNTLGTFCIDTGLPCDFNHSTCSGKNEFCYGRGPGYPDEFESTRIIGEKQFKMAVELFNKAEEKLQGKIGYQHAYIDFSNLQVTVPKEGCDDCDETVKTCPAAMGFGFAAGTTDGPGAFDFKQGDDQGNTFWRRVRNVLKTPGPEQVQCQKPKPILLDTGEMKIPYDWAVSVLYSLFHVKPVCSDTYVNTQPSILPIQIFRVGQLIILSVPGEFTTMAGRRLRDAIKSFLISLDGEEFSDNLHVVIAGLSNTYSQYITTFEEYEVQRYEGASTLYGPHTLTAYIQEFKKLALALVNGETLPRGPQPPNLLDKQISLLADVVVDGVPGGLDFGDVKVDVPPNASYARGHVVNATFWSACPRNDLMTEGSFAVVEMQLRDGGNWVPVYDDDEFCVKFKWSRSVKMSPVSQATVEWRIPESAVVGVYRLRYNGAFKALRGKITSFSGSSRAFVVV